MIFLVMRRYIYTIVCFLFVGCVVAMASETLVLTGVVTDDKGEPIPFCSITVKGSSVGTVSDSEGKYTLEAPKGEHELLAYCLGFKNYSSKIRIVASTSINIKLQEDAVALQDVNVVHKSDGAKVKDDIYAVNAIDVDAKISSIQNLSSLVEDAVGVKIRREGGLGSDYELTLNGMGGNSIRYFIDGVPLDTKGGDFSLDNIPANIVERIEVYKGVVPAHLGGDALGGAIDIITKKDRRNYYDLSYGGGSFHTHVADFNAQIVAPKSGIAIKPTLSFNYSKNDYTMKDVRVVTDDYEYETGNFKRFNDAYRSMFGQVEVGVADKKWADQFFVGLSYNDVYKEIQTGATQDVVYGGALRLSNALGASFRYRKVGLFTEGLTISANASYTLLNSTLVDTTTMLFYWNGFGRELAQAEINSYPIMRYFDRTLATARVNADYKIGEWSAINFNYLLQSTSSEMSQRSDVDSTYNGEGATDILLRQYLGLSYNLNLFENRWHTSFFVKEYINKVEIDEKEYGDGSYGNAHYDANRNTTSYFTSYGAGTRYKFMEELSARFSYEYSVRLPGSIELLGDGENINPNYALEPEKSNNYNLSLYGMLIGERSLFNYEVGGFYRDIYDFIMPVQGSESYTYTNLSNILISGLETELSYTFDNAFQLHGNFTYEYAVDMLEFKLTDGKPNASYMQAIPNRPNFYSNLGASYTFRNLFDKGDRLMFEYQYDYTKWFYLTWATYGHPDSKAVIPTQHSHGATASYSWKYNRYSISFDCNNLFDTLLYDNYRLQKPGRAYFCKLRMFIN